MKYSGKTVFFFDVDGVLVNSVHSRSKPYARWDLSLYEDVGIEKDFLQPFFKKSFTRALEGKADLTEGLSQFLSGTPHSGRAKEIIEYWFAQDSELNAPLIKIVEHLKAKKFDVYLATNQEHMRARYLWSEMKLKKHFKKIFYSADIGHTKEEPAFYLKINKQLNFNPAVEKFVYFDDNPLCIEQATKAGWTSFLYKNVQSLIQDLNSLEDASNLIEDRYAS